MQRLIRIALLLAVAVASATAGPAAETPETGTGHALYFVVVSDVRAFDEATRKELGVQGPLKTHWPQRNRFRKKHGYFGWLTEQDVERIAKHSGVVSVDRYLPEDVVVAERPRGTAKNFLDVEVVPSVWKAGVDPSTYVAPEALADDWKKRFAEVPALTIDFDPQTELVRFTFAGVKPDPAIVDALRRSGQVQSMHWTQEPKAASKP